MRFDRLLCVVVSTAALAFACGRGHGHHEEGQGSVHSISGTVHDSSGVAGLESVTVTLSGDSSGALTTGPDGAFSFADLEDGSYTVTPSREGFTFSPASVSMTLSGTDRAGVDFAASAAIPPGHTISGTITGASDVTVTLSGAASRSTTTDTDGVYAFADLADGDYTVAPSKEGFTFSPESAPVTLSGADRSSVDFTASEVGPALHSISGTLHGASASATVTLSGAASATTGIADDGRYRFANLADGEYVVTPNDGANVLLFDPPSTTVHVSGADVSGVDFTGLHSIWGFVSGALGGEVVVWAMSAEGRVGAGGGVRANGFYTIDLVPPGIYTVTPMGTSFVFSPASATVTVRSSDAGPINFVASYAQNRTISGTVYGASEVRVDLEPFGSAPSVTTDAQGRYSFTNLSADPQYYYVVTPHKLGYSFSPESAGFSLGQGDATADFTATPLPTHDISGTITGVADVGMVTVITATGSDVFAPPFFTIPFPDGTYALTDLPDDSYTVTPSAGGYAFSPESRLIVLSGADVSGVDFVGTLQ